MATRQRIVPVRRDYNRWVADETLEDYALRFTAVRARRWSPLRVANTALGSISFLALEAIGGTITMAYGVPSSIAAILMVSALIVLVSLPICYYAARDGVDIDLLTRGAGFGYIGSTITSLIYASFTFIFFGIEAVILAAMLHSFFGVPEWLGYILCAVAVVPLVTHGITFISRLQVWTQPVWLVLNLLPLAAVLAVHGGMLDGWLRFGGAGRAPEDGRPFDLLAFGAAASILFALVTQTCEQVDYIRFLPPRTRENRGTWWLALLAGGPGWIVFDILKLLAGSFLAYVLLRLGLSAWQAVQPAEMYRLGFALLVGSPVAALVLTAVFVTLSQIKINVTNAYAGSLAWSNFFSRLTHSHPGRVVWVVFNIAIALLLMELGVYRAIEGALVFYSNVAAAWVGALVADLVVNKPLGLSPPYIEFKRAHLYDINPVGVGSMLLAATASLLAAFGMLGEVAQALSTFLAFGIAFAAAPLIAWGTRGRYYLARKPRAAWGRAGSLQCVVCENAFEPPDMAYCPVYAGPICSLCCTLDSRCGDGCKPHARADRQLGTLMRALLPEAAMRALARPLGAWLAGFALFVATSLLVFLAIASRAGVPPELASAYWTVCLIQLVVGGVVLWLLVLARESHRVAREETQRQTSLLMSEIAAHRRTDAALQKAKEKAEAASQAKSRYVVGLSHELRSPLNAILGYAQLLEREDAGGGLSDRRREGLRTIRRSGEHLLALIEGLLDVSKIETGRIELYRDEVRLPEFLDQLVQMLRLQAEARHIGFRFERPERIPALVYTDERRLRQILLNLLSNAIKFTREGEVSLRLRWRSQVAEFEVTDTGPGIPEADQARIFEPFQRLAGTESTPGIGLGLTICKLLAEVMGGEITVTSRAGEGSRFRLRLMLSEATQAPRPAPPAQRVTGYSGERRSVIVADDDPSQRALMLDLLAPLGFTVLAVADGAECRRLAAEWQPDLFLIDLAMPGIPGWELARLLREDGSRAPIIVISANTRELKAPPDELYQGGRFHDDVLAKPVSLPVLLDKIALLLGLEWTGLEGTGGGALPPPAPPAVPPPLPAAPGTAPLRPDQLRDLRELAAIGYVGGLRARLDAIEAELPAARDCVARLRALLAEYRLEELSRLLEAPAPD
ncbi:ATP-binding protein [Roseomonas sp. NAR14]|uniref:histidine kinase n=1 Tax=Roseomonas acroporae TaxID=2937791 RepID=A0A9X2BTV1_9PROT|nr:ATP-binding protein [Roseomonas acroporae]MCK8785023.1 ATP-binding protein [Roseomonas acroporae]